MGTGPTQTRAGSGPPPRTRPVAPAPTGPGHGKVRHAPLPQHPGVELSDVPDGVSENHRPSRSGLSPTRPPPWPKRGPPPGTPRTNLPRDERSDVPAGASQNQTLHDRDCPRNQAETPAEEDGAPPGTPLIRPPRDERSEVPAGASENQAHHDRDCPLNGTLRHPAIECPTRNGPAWGRGRSGDGGEGKPRGGVPGRRAQTAWPERVDGWGKGKSSSTPSGCVATGCSPSRRSRGAHASTAPGSGATRGSRNSGVRPATASQRSEEGPRGSCPGAVPARARGETDLAVVTTKRPRRGRSRGARLAAPFIQSR